MRPGTKSGKNKKEDTKANGRRKSNSQINFTIDIQDNVYVNTFDDTLCNSSYKNGKIKIDSYEDFIDYINSLFKKYNPNIPELNYDKLSTITSQGKINKFCNSITKMVDCKTDTIVIPETSTYSKGNYTTFQASTGLIKGNFCYEVIVASPVNAIMVIGFMQDTTIVSEELKSGIGNTEDSYGFDLKSLKKINNNIAHDYANKTINQGDVIGVCISLNSKSSFIEYYLNGETLGKCFFISTKENKAYYPAVSLQGKTGVFFNCGGIRHLVYEYEDFEPIDTPVSKYSKAKSVTKSLLDILKVNGNELLLSNEINEISKIQIFGDILEFLAYISFSDSYLIRRFLFKFLEEQFDERIKILERISMCSNKKTEFLENIVYVLIYEIEYLSYGDNYDKWKGHMSLLIKMLKTKYIFDAIRGYSLSINTLKKLFKPYRYREESYEEQFKKFITSNNDINTDNMPNISKQFRKKLKVFKGKTFKGYPHQGEQNMLFKQIISILFDIKADNIIKKYIVEMIKKMKEISGYRRYDDQLFTNFMSTVFFNMIDLFFELNTNQDYENISISQYLNNDNLIPFQETLGGTLTYVFNTFPKEIKNFSSFAKKPRTKCTNILNCILFVFYSSVLKNSAENYSNCLKHISFIKYNEYYTLQEDYKANRLVNHLLIFNKENVRSFSRLISYLCCFYSYLHSKSLLYFYPMVNALLPYSMLKILTNEKCLNEHFINDYSPAEKVIHYLFRLLPDEKIINPGIKEKLYEMISELIPKSKFQVYFDNEELLKSLFNGICKIIKKDYSIDISKFVQFLLCERRENAKPSQLKLFHTIVSMFKSNKELFLHFYETYVNILNQSMTMITTILSELNNDPDEQRYQLEELYLYFQDFNETGIIFEFTVDNMRVLYEDTQNVEFKLLLNFIVNVSNRILDYVSVEKFTKLIVQEHNTIIKQLLSQLCNRVINMFLSLRKQFEINSPFIKNFVSHNELNLLNFSYITELYHVKVLQNEPSNLKAFNEYINALLSLSSELHVKSAFTPKDWEEIDKNDNICIICYENDITHHFVPCNHGCCLCCLKQYLLSKNFCFLCHQKIEKIKEDESIVINK